MNEMSRMFSGSRSKDQWMVPWPYRGELVGVVVVTCTPLRVDRLAFKLGGGGEGVGVEDFETHYGKCQRETSLLLIGVKEPFPPHSRGLVTSSNPPFRGLQKCREIHFIQRKYNLFQFLVPLVYI